MRILIVGDVHGQLGALQRIALRAWMVLGIDAIIQIGDFGFFPKVLVAYQRTWGRFPVPVHAIDGNHEDHAWLARCVADGTATEIWAERLNLHYHPRGTISHLGGATVGWLGGALHADRPQEGYTTAQDLHAPPRPSNVIRPDDQTRALAAWRAEPPDLLVTHTNPSGLGIGMRGSPHLTTQVEEVITAAGWDAGPAEDIGDSALTAVITQLPPAARRTLVFGHHHRWHRAMVDHPLAGRIEACCVGSADATDGHIGLNQTAVYDTATRELSVGGRLPVLRRDLVVHLRCALAAIAASDGPVPVATIAAVIGKGGKVYRHFQRNYTADLMPIRPGSGPMAVPHQVAVRFLQDILDSDVFAESSVSESMATPTNKSIIARVEASGQFVEDDTVRQDIGDRYEEFMTFMHGQTHALDANRRPLWYPHDYLRFLRGRSDE